MKNKNITPDEEIYSDEELKMFNSIENGNYTSMPSDELNQTKDFYSEVATNTIEKMTKKKSYNLRLFESDIQNIKAMALEKGLPYQTLLSSIIHQVATKQIKLN